MNIAMIIKTTAFLLLFGMQSGCSAFYKQDVEQGNLMTSAQIAKVHVGMTKDQVRYLLGTPVMSHVLDCDRWDYVYTCQISRGPMNVKRLSLDFRQGRLVAVHQ